MCFINSKKHSFVLFCFVLHFSEIQVHLRVAFGFDLVVNVSLRIELEEYILAGLKENPRVNGWNTNVTQAFDGTEDDIVWKI